MIYRFSTENDLYSFCCRGRWLIPGCGLCSFTEFSHCDCCLYPNYGLVSLGFLGCLARAVDGVYVLASMLVVMLGRPVCKVWFWWLYRADALSLCFRGGAVHLLSSLVSV